MARAPEDAGERESAQPRRQESARLPRAADGESFLRQRRGRCLGLCPAVTEVGRGAARTRPEWPHGHQYATTHRNQAAPEVAADGTLVLGRQPVRVELRTAARVFAFRRSARPRTRPGGAAGRQGRRGYLDARTERQLRSAADILRRAQHGHLFLGLPVLAGQEPRYAVAAIPRAPRRGPDEPRAGPSAFRAAAEIKIAEPCCPRLHHFLRPERLAPSRSSS